MGADDRVEDGTVKPFYTMPAFTFVGVGDPALDRDICRKFKVNVFTGMIKPRRLASRWVYWRDRYPDPHRARVPR